MTEEEKEAIKYLKKHIIPYNNINGNIEFLVNDVLLNLIEKLQKAIDLMAELLCGIDVMNELGRDSWNWNKEQMKEHFYKKVEEEND